MPIKRSRKPVCPACGGQAFFLATRYQPAEECEFCNGGRKQLTKRQVVRYHKRAAARSRRIATGTDTPADRQIFHPDFDLEQWINDGMPF